MSTKAVVGHDEQTDFRFAVTEAWKKRLGEAAPRWLVYRIRDSSNELSRTAPRVTAWAPGPLNGSGQVPQLTDDQFVDVKREKAGTARQAASEETDGQLWVGCTPPRAAASRNGSFSGGFSATNSKSRQARPNPVAVAKSARSMASGGRSKPRGAGTRFGRMLRITADESLERITPSPLR